MTASTTTQSTPAQEFAQSAEPGARPDPRRWWALGFLVSGYFLVFSGVTMMNIALPAAQDDLGMSGSERQWVITVYSLTFGGLLLLGGRVADLIGLRRGAIAGLLGFAGASLLGALAPNGLTLLAGRALQGASGALVVAASLALLSVTFSHGAERGRAFGVLGTVMGLGTAGSFVAGGALTDAFSWRWCLLINVPIALVAAVGLARTTGHAVSSRPRLDVLGAGTITLAVAALVIGFDRASVEGWGSWQAVSSLLVGAGLLIAFVAVQRRVAAPLLPLGILTDRARAAAYLAVFVLAIGFFAGFYFLTIYLQDVRGYSPLRTGLAFLPFGLTATVSARYLASALLRVSPGPLLVGGLLSIVAGIANLARLDTTSSYAVDLVPTFLLLGLGGSAVMLTASNLATVDAGAHTGVAGAAVGASQQIGAALGTALLGSIAASATAQRLDARVGTATDPDATVHGFGQALTVGTLVILAGTLVVGLVLVNWRTVRSPEPRPHLVDGRAGELAGCAAGTAVPD